jgi:alpha-tubulin suppressor-like RCC1 family protein
MGTGVAAGNFVYPVPCLNLSNIGAIDAKSSHCLAVDNDGGVWTWGLNTSRQCGDASASPKSTPSKVTDVSDVIVDPKYVSVGLNYSFVAKDMP